MVVDVVAVAVEFGVAVAKMLSSVEKTCFVDV